MYLLKHRKYIVELRKDGEHRRQVFCVTMELRRGRRHNFLSGRASGTRNRGIIRVARMVCASLTLAILLGVLAPHIVLAQENGIERVNATTGDYEITVWEDPSNLATGRTSFVVRVLNATTGEPVPHTRVVIRFVHAALARYGRANALNTPDSPEYYEAPVTMYTPGVWKIRVEVSGSLGRVLVELAPVEVPRLRSYMSGSVVFIGVSLVVVLAGGYLWWSIRGQHRRRATSPANEGLGEEGEPED